jgi:hypothetical protein
MRDGLSQLLARQSSHILLVMNNCLPGRQLSFIEWYQGAYRDRLGEATAVIRSQHYEQHEVDVTCGRHMMFPYRYLALYHLSIDGAEQAAGFIDSIHSRFRQCDAADAPATWLYYPVSEKVGRSPDQLPSLLTIAFANAVPGTEAEFFEWYSTRHIRHALNIPALVSGQCFDRTRFQRPGAADCSFSMIAIYEQEGSPQDIIESFATLPKETFHFPMLDKTRGRFAECVFRPIG